jgi:hypothetical protein
MPCPLHIYPHLLIMITHMHILNTSTVEWSGCILTSNIHNTLATLVQLPGSEGLGKATAAALAKRGLNIVLVSRSQQKLDSAAAEIRSQHPGVEVRGTAERVMVADTPHAHVR